MIVTKLKKKKITDYVLDLWGKDIFNSLLFMEKKFLTGKLINFP